MCLCQCLQGGMRKASFFFRTAPARCHDRAICDGKALVRNDQLRIEFHFVADSRAGWAGAKRIVEGKVSRFNLPDADAAVRAGKVGGEMNLVIFIHRKDQLSVFCPAGIFPGFRFYSAFRPGDDLHCHQPFCLLQNVLNGIRQTGFYSGFHDQTVDNDINIMFIVFF